MPKARDSGIGNKGFTAAWPAKLNCTQEDGSRTSMLQEEHISLEKRPGNAHLGGYPIRNLLFPPA